MTSTYQVQAGQKISEIADVTGVTFQDIIDANPGKVFEAKNGNKYVHAGATLTIPDVKPRNRGEIVMSSDAHEALLRLQRGVMRDLKEVEDRPLKEKRVKKHEENSAKKYNEGDRVTVPVTIFGRRAIVEGTITDVTTDGQGEYVYTVRCDDMSLGEDLKYSWRAYNPIGGLVGAGLRQADLLDHYPTYVVQVRNSDGIQIKK